MISYVLLIVSLLIFPFVSDAAAASAKDDVKKCFDTLLAMQWEKARDLCLTPEDAFLVDEQIKSTNNGEQIPVEDVNRLVKPIFAKVKYTIGDEYVEAGKQVVKVHLNLPDLRPVLMIVFGEVMTSIGQSNFQIDSNFLNKTKETFDRALANPALPMVEFDVPLPMIETATGWRIDSSEDAKKIAAASGEIKPGDGMTASSVSSVQSPTQQSDAGIFPVIPENPPSVKEEKSSDAVNAFFHSFISRDYQKGYNSLTTADRAKYSFEDYKKMYGLDDKNRNSWKGFNFACSLFDQSNDAVNRYRCTLLRADVNDPAQTISMDYNVNVVKDAGEWRVDLSSIRKAD